MTEARIRRVLFRYYAVYDPKDYDQVKGSNGRYVVEDSWSDKLSYKERADLIFE